MLTWLQQWFSSQCDGEWEHEYGVKINTLDNPGWSVQIDLAFTELEDVRIEITEPENSLKDWYSIIIVDSVFNGYCSPNYLEYIISEFKSLVELGAEGFAAVRPQIRNIPYSEGYSINKGLPKPIRQLLYSIIDNENISPINMPEKGAFLANAILPNLERLVSLNNIDIQSLVPLVYKYGWDYLYSKTAGRTSN